ncbi:MAG: hypothetical protein JST93_20615 [Acidobacteria bacterium]|nr:hypothetical protein [Acidobacteriota bacterium]
MRIPWAPFAFLLLPPFSSAQPELSPDALFLAKVKLRAAENLEKLPNYTCLETIERSRRRVSTRRFELVDLLRLEVGLVDRKELFAWPGSGEFTDTEIADMVGHGAIGNGSFALHARSLFLSGIPDFTYIGERIREGRATHRWAYRVPLIHSGYTMRVKPQKGIVGYQGSVWVDASTLDLLRIEIQVTEIPPNLPISTSTETLDYQSVPIAGANFLLPQSSELTIVDLQGNESRNRTRFSNCRQFSGESVLTFDEAPGAVSETRKPSTKIELPADLEPELELRTAIEPGVTAVGDAVEAIVTKDVKRKGVVYLPKGAKVTGRVWKLERLQSTTRTEWEAGLLFLRFSFDNSYGEFHARLTPPFPGSTERHSALESVRVHTVVRDEPVIDPRIGILNLKGERGKLPLGTRLNWRTLLPPSQEKP